ncbi:MAG: hypothetical protein ACREFB_16655, partial [Stellaceae bacterium]
MVDHLPGEYPAGKPLKGRRWITGKSTGIRTSATGDEAEYAQALIDQFGDELVYPAIKAARTAIDPAYQPVTVLDMRQHERWSLYTPAHLASRRILTMPRNTPGLVALDDETYALNDEPAPTMKTAEAVEVVESEAIITLWATDPGKNSKPGYKAIKRKRAVIAQLFDFLAIPAIREFTDPRDDDKRRRTYRAFDLTQADADAIQRFKETIPVEKQNDVLSHVAAIYNAAGRERKFAKLPGGNPVKDLYVPPKPKP